MDLSSKLRILADAAKYDASCASSGAKRDGNGKGLGNNSGCGVCHSYTPDGRCISLLKILLTNYCIYDCIFCVNRMSSDIQRTRFTVAEVVELTLDFYKRNYIEGLFLSSGIIQSPDYTMEQLIAVAKALRQQHGFNGYIHLKAIPGASELLLNEAGLWADRLSANIELPTQDDLDALAPEKKTTVIESTMGEIKAKHDESRQERRRTVARRDSLRRGRVRSSSWEQRRRAMRRFCGRLIVFTTAMGCGEFTIRPSARIRKLTRDCHSRRRRFCENIGFIRLIGCCGTTISRSRK